MSKLKVDIGYGIQHLLGKMFTMWSSQTNFQGIGNHLLCVIAIHVAVTLVVVVA